MKNLPLLTYTLEDNLFSLKTGKEKPKPKYINPQGKNEYYTTASNFKGKDRQRERARFWPGIAEAMAQQWG